MSANIGFDGRAFAVEFIGRRARRWLQRLLDGIGRDNLLYLIKNNKDLLSYAPPEVLQNYLATFPISKEDLKYFTDSELYSWLPDGYREAIEAEPTGKKWAHSLIKSIKKRIASS